MTIKLVKNERTNKIILSIIFIALIVASAVLISIIIMYFASLEETGGG